MMRFRCPHCQQILEVAEVTDILLCPACERWCRIPISEEFELSGERRFEIPPRVPYEDSEPRLAPSNSPIIPPSEAITPQRNDDLPFRLREDEVEDVQLEIVSEGEEPRRRKRRRRARHGGFNVDYWIGPTLILMIFLVPGSLFLIVLSFFLHPGAGFGAIFMVVGGVWLILIAAEDSLGTALMVLFVPFYYWYFAFTNFERVALPFLMNFVGTIVFTVSLAVEGIHAAETGAKPLPVPAVCRCACWRLEETSEERFA
jgi:hypothetical protein